MSMVYASTKQTSFWLPGILICFISCSPAQLLRAQNISGIWQGVAYQPFGGSTDCYPITLYLVQNGSQLSGSSYTVVAGTPYFAEMNVVGSVSGNQIQYKENFIISKKDVPGYEWCLSYGNLTYDPTLERIRGVLKGNTPGGAVCEEAILEVYRLQILSPLVFCQAGTHTLQVAGQLVKWYADKDLKQLIGTGNTITRNISQNTTFYITQTTQYCSTPSPAAALEVKISDLTAVPVLVEQPSCRAGGSIEISATGGKPPYLFSLNGGAFQSGTKFHSLLSGNYTLIVRDALACERTLTLALDPPPVPAVAVAATPAECLKNGTATATAAGGTPPYQFVWNHGMTASHLQDVPAGSYTVTLTDAGGCTASASVVVAAATDVPVLKFSVEKSGCGQPTGSIVTAIDGGKAPYRFQWSNGSAAKDLLQLAAGFYALTVTDLAGCSTTARVEVPASEPVQVRFDEDSLFIQAGEHVVLRPQILPATTQLLSTLWSPEQGLSCTDCLEPTASPASPVMYTLSVRNADQCTATASVWVTPRYLRQASVFVPNVFSPNDDGIDDNFAVFLSANAEFLLLQIFDRWGNLIFESHRPDHLWDGKYRGKPLPSDVYSYALRYRDGGSRQIKIWTGDVTILR